MIGQDKFIKQLSLVFNALKYFNTVLTNVFELDIV